MNIIKKITLMAILLNLIFSGLVLSCNRNNGNQNGTVNKIGPLTWEIKDQTLIINGEGPMPNFSTYAAPWNVGDNENIISIIINEGVTHIGNHAFYRGGGLAGIYGYDRYANVVHISLPNTLISIGENAFRGFISLTSIVIPDGVINIEKSAFQGCRSLRRVELGENVSFIAADAFYPCRNISYIISKNPVPPILEICFPKHEDIMVTSWSFDDDYLAIPPSRINKNENKYKNVWNAFSSSSEYCRLIVPEEAIPAYRADSQWSRFFE